MIKKLKFKSIIKYYIIKIIFVLIDFLQVTVFDIENLRARTLS
jgi:hypothetical protein